jgi:cobalamin biosynthesis protein CobT
LAEKVLKACMNCSSACSKPGAGASPMIPPTSAPPASESERPGRGVSMPGAEAPPPRLRFPPPTSTYDRAMARVAGQLHHLTSALEDLLRPRRRLHETAGYRSGHRLDLRRVMSFEADPRQWDKLWRRKSIPDRHQTAVSLLVDLSGSMSGPKTDAAQAGTVLMAEALHRLQIPFAINGFQDRLIRFADFNEGLTERIRNSLGEMPLEVAARRPGGNNVPGFNDDGPCLREAAEQLLSTPADDRILIVASDGMPAGRRSTEQDLRNVIRLLAREPRLWLIGVGIGPDTDHVSNFYPHSRASVPLEQFAGVLAGLLRALLE